MEAAELEIADICFKPFKDFKTTKHIAQNKWIQRGHKKKQLPVQPVQ
jgi:hypothetical protein